MKSKFVPRPPVVRPSVALIISELLRSRIFYDYFSLSLTLDPMGANISKHYSFKSLLILFKLFFCIFCLLVLTKILFLDRLNPDFTIFQDFFFVFVNMGPYASQNCKKANPRSNRFDFCTKLLNFLLSGPHKSTVLDF